jgi:hypothetical protein
MVYCKTCGKESKKRICKDCQYLLDNGADEETIKRMKSNDFVNAIWEKNKIISEKLADAYYQSVIDNYKKKEDSKENFGYNTFIDGIKLGLDIIIPMLDEKTINIINAKIKSMIIHRNKFNNRR